MSPPTQPVKLASGPPKSDAMDRNRVLGRRGGARRGPTAAEELARRKAQQLANNINQDINCDDNDCHSPRNAPGPFTLSSPSTIEIGPQLSSLTPEDCTVGLLSPLSGITGRPELLGAVESPSWSIRAYGCHEDLINAYYTFIHPYFPLLPPPAAPQREDQFINLRVCSSYADASVLPYWPTSSVGLALAAILVLIPLPEDVNAISNGAFMLRRAYSGLYVRSALESLEDALGQSLHSDMAKDLPSSLHPGIPQQIEPILTLGLLSMYECCQGGNVAKMRVRANQALTIAMDISLHVENRHATEFLDAYRRCWWMTVFLVYQSSTMSASPPIVTFDDLRITTPYPEFRGCREPWPLLVNGQTVLFRSCCIARQLLVDNNSDSQLPRSFGDDLRGLDSYIMDLAAEADRFRCVTNYQGAEADASRNLWAISNAIIHTSRLMLHGVRAFMDHPIFQRNHCDFLATHLFQSPRPVVQNTRLSTGRIAEISGLFPFTEQESVRICLHSSLVVSRIFRRLPSPNPMYSDAVEVGNVGLWASQRALGSPRSIPYMACCQIQSFYVLAMILWSIRAAVCSGTLDSCYHLFDRESPNTKVQDAERLVEELTLGMKALETSIRADMVFEGVRILVEEVEKLYETTDVC
ncbi:hypothetical protein FE257_011758 [Aspergillus nanangensis]|uniref:Transcription factor domain-containing protein n=1 Tax=Aspergillus nanangensis TaxID=2582783 RepID=A0AAD4CV75_ASPNN|nr:hypothetical protein FE257_011758 [Aspergillus nanangensis]